MAQIQINGIVYGSNNASDIVYRDITVEEKLDSVPYFDITDNVDVETNSDYLTYGHIIDNLTSTSTNNILSANQGKILNDKISTLSTTHTTDKNALNTSINNLSSSVTTNTNNIASNYTTLNNKITTNSNNISSINKKIDTTSARSVYISPSGDDTTGKGTSSAPWKTFAKALENDPPLLYQSSSASYTIFVAAGTYTENIAIFGKHVSFNLQGNVIIKPSNKGTSAINVQDRGYLSITSTQSTKPTLQINGCTTAFYCITDSFLTIANLSNLTISNATTRGFYVASKGYLTVGSTVEKLTIGASNTDLTSIASSTSGGYMSIAPAASDIQSGGTSSSYAFTVGNAAYIFLDNLTIPKSYTKGIQATHCGRAEVDTVTNNATTPTSTGTGGTII